MILGRLLVGLVLSGMLAACASAGGNENATPDPELVAVGADLYQANCAVCHGSDLRGTNQGPSLLSIVYEPGHHGDGAFLIAVTRGVPAHHWNFGPMPPVPGLSVSDVEAIVAFVRDQQRIQGFEPYPR